MGYSPDLTRALVESILRRPHDHEWSLQGLGMLRTYLPGDWRLHVWSSEDAAKGVSRLHDHPWSFTSYLIAGRLTNIRYEPLPVRNRNEELYARSQDAKTWKRVRILCGPDGGTVSAPDELWLRRCTPEKYDAKGHGVYQQAAHEIHESIPEHGTVSVIKRIKSEDADHANVYFPVGETYGNAGGAHAVDRATIERITGYALTRWFA